MSRLVVVSNLTLDGVMQAPGRPDEDLRGGFKHGGWALPYSDVLNNAQKYVASRMLQEPLPWGNSTLLKGDAAEDVARLKEQPGKDIVVLGSGELIRSLMGRSLVDEYVLLIHPLVLGSGRRLFTDEVPLGALRLVDSVMTTAGVLIVTYQPGEPTAGKTA